MISRGFRLSPVRVSICREVSNEIGGAARIGPSYFGVVAAPLHRWQGVTLCACAIADGGALRSLETVGDTFGVW